MRLTNFSDTARRVLLLTGAASEGTRLTTAAIAEGVSAPYHHVAKTVSRLSGLGPLASTRGDGGIAITRARLGASVGSLLRDLEAGSAMVACEAPGCQCPLVHDCRLRHAQAQVREAFYRALDDVHVPDLITAQQIGPTMVPLGLRPPDLQEPPGHFQPPGPPAAWVEATRTRILPPPILAMHRQGHGAAHPGRGRTVAVCGR